MHSPTEALSRVRPVDNTNEVHILLLHITPPVLPGSPRAQDDLPPLDEPGGVWNLAQITWKPEDETLDSGVDRQQQPAGDVFMDTIVALGMSLDKEDKEDK